MCTDFNELFKNNNIRYIYVMTVRDYTKLRKDPKDLAHSG